MNSKYSNILTIVLIIVIILIVAILGFLGYKFYSNIISRNNADDFVDSFVSDIENNIKPDKDKEENKNETENDGNWNEGIQEGDNTSNGNSGVSMKYKGFNVSGTIEIPVISLKYPIIAQSDYSKSALEIAVVEIYGDGLNQVGNAVISGHNYRNGALFSNNKKLNIGDKIYITDLTGKRLAYTIYNKFETTENDTAPWTRDTQGATEITLSTCTDDSKMRLIISAKADV